MRAVCGNWRVWIAIVVVLTATKPAHAFYWQNWPGSQLRTERTLIFPPTTTLPGSPPTVPPVIQPPTQVYPPVPPVGPPIPVDRPPIGPPEQTPEPATGVLGALGLGALVVLRKWRKK